MPYADPERNREYQRNYQREWFLQNRDSINERKRRWRDKQRETGVRVSSESAEYRSRNRKRYLYNLTDEQIESLGERCEICGTTEGRMHIDHDHTCCPGTGSCGNCVRGLLCERCNVGLGMFRDDSDALLAAVFYLGGVRK